MCTAAAEGELASATMLHTDAVIAAAPAAAAHPMLLLCADHRPLPTVMHPSPRRYESKMSNIKEAVETRFPSGIDVIATPTPTLSGRLDVYVDGELVHSKKRDGYVDSKEKLDAIMAAIATVCQAERYNVIVDAAADIDGFAVDTPDFIRIIAMMVIGYMLTQFLLQRFN